MEHFINIPSLLTFPSILLSFYKLGFGVVWDLFSRLLFGGGESVLDSEVSEGKAVAPAGTIAFQNCFHNWRENLLAGIPGHSSLKVPPTWLA